MHHEIRRTCRFRKGDDVTDVICSCKQHDKAVQPVCDSAVRRSAVLECFDQEAELFVALFLCEPECFEHLLLHFCIMYTDGSTAELVAVQHDIICIGL